MRFTRQNDRFKRSNVNQYLNCWQNSWHDVNRRFVFHPNIDGDGDPQMKTLACTINSWPEEIFPDRFPARSVFQPAAW